MPVEVRLAKRRRDDRLGEVAAERLLARPAERLLRLRVPGDDDAVGVHADERVVRGVEDQVRARVALGHLRQRFAAALVGDRDGDQVGGRDREVLLVDRPRPRAADVLGAEHAAHRRCRWRSGTSSIAPMFERLEIRRRGTRWSADRSWRRGAAITRSCSIASK